MLRAHEKGNKKDNVTIIYTPWSNLKKDGSMATGQVGFKDNKKVKRVYVEKRENAIVNRLNKTKVEKLPDLAMEREERAKELRKKDRASQQIRVRMEDCKMRLRDSASHKIEMTDKMYAGQRGSPYRQGEEAARVRAGAQIR